MKPTDPMDTTTVIASVKRELNPLLDAIKQVYRKLEAVEENIKKLQKELVALKKLQEQQKDASTTSKEE